MEEWGYAQSEASEQLARHQTFSVKKRQGEADIEFVITVKEFATPKDRSMRFFAQTDKQTNRNSAPFTPSGWGDTLLKALAECIQAIHLFPYEGAS